MTQHLVPTILLAGFAVLAAGCARGPVDDVQPPPSEPGSAGGGCPAAPRGVLSGTLYGALQRELATGSPSVACQGMPRPAERGIRLQFRVSPQTGDGPLVLIIGIDDIDRNDTGKSIRSTVTIIDESGNRFFSTGDQPSCFSDIERHRYRETELASDIEGVLWCTAAIPEINGENSVRLTELRFAGRVNWPAEG